MEEQFLTKQQMAEKLQVTERTIDNWIKDGVLTPVKGIPVIRFSARYVAELEGIKFEQFSPLLKRKLERELKEVTRERDILREAMNNILALTARTVIK